MTRDKATTILAGLTAAFPNVRLEDDTPDVWRKHLAPLDFEVADRAVGQCVDNLKFFPSVAEFREFYRLERHNQPKPRPMVEDVSGEIPAWVQVWRWHSDRTMISRQAANTAALGPVEKRQPVKMRPFPQTAHLELHENPLTWDEYEDLEREWVEAGRPSIGQVSELLEAVGA